MSSVADALEKLPVSLSRFFFFSLREPGEGAVSVLGLDEGALFSIGTRATARRETAAAVRKERRGDPSQLPVWNSHIFTTYEGQFGLIPVSWHVVLSSIFFFFFEEGFYPVAGNPADPDKWGIP